MQFDPTDAMLRHGDAQRLTGVTARRGAAVRTLAQPANAPAATNIATTIGLIACLLLVWAIIVT